MFLPSGFGTRQTSIQARQTQLSQSDVQRSSLPCCPWDEQSVIKDTGCEGPESLPLGLDHSGPGCVEPAGDGGQGPSLWSSGCRQLTLGSCAMSGCGSPLLFTPHPAWYTQSMFISNFPRLSGFPYILSSAGKESHRGALRPQESLPGPLWFCVHQQ